MMLSLGHADAQDLHNVANTVIQNDQNDYDCTAAEAIQSACVCVSGNTRNCLTTTNACKSVASLPCLPSLAKRKNAVQTIANKCISFE